MTNCHRLKLPAADGKKYLTVVATAETLLRLVQSVPSPKAEHEIKKGEEFAILTNLIHQEWSGVSVKSHKELKNLKTQNLRDHMSEAELIFTALAELSTRQIAETTDATGIVEHFLMLNGHLF